MRRVLRALAIETGPLRRHREFRLLFTALLGGALAGAHDRPRLVLIAASALDGFRRNAAQIAGPALAGVLIATLGFERDLRHRRRDVPGLARLPRGCARFPCRRRRRRRASPGSARAGATRSRQELIGSYAVDVNAMLFGIPAALSRRSPTAAAAGAADMSSGIFRQTLWNQTIPDRMRGRLAGIEQLSYSIGPTLGTARSGALASAMSVRFSIASGGVACVAGTVVLCALLPRFWRYEARVVNA